MPNEFNPFQIQTRQIIASGSLANNLGAKIVIYGDNVASDNSGSINQTYFPTSSLEGQDIFLYISGGIGDKDSNNRSISVFGGDVYSSGSISAQSFTGSITNLSNGLPLIVSSVSGVLIEPNSSGQIVISASWSGSREQVKTATGLDTTFNPIAFWKLDGNLLDSSGNNHHISGKEEGRYFSGSFNRLAYCPLDATCSLVNNALFRVTGAITFECMLKINFVIIDGNPLNIFSCYGTGETEATNYLYSFRFYENNNPGYWYEYSSGTNGAIVTGSMFATRDTWHYYAVARDEPLTGSQRIRIFLDQYKVEERYVPAVTGGGSTTVYPLEEWRGFLQDVKIIFASLTDEEIQSEAERCGFVT